MSRSLRWQCAWRMLALAAVAVAMLSTVTAWRGIPNPAVQDEFSYLLGADTFRHGRLANPVPPYPEHFETFHTLVRPTYMSKYQPGSAVVMALGSVVFGHPYWGVVISSALCAAFAYWAVLPYAGRYWATVSGVLYVLGFCMLHYWGRSYWGGSLAFLGAIFVMGGYGWWSRSGIPSSAWMMCTGFALLILTRPFEGFFLCFAVCAAVVGRLFRERARPRHLIRTWVPPLLVVMGGVLLFQALFNQAVTGSWKRFPYAEHWDQYVTASAFWFLPPATEVAKGESPEFMRRFQQWEVQSQMYRQQMGLLKGFVWRAASVAKIAEMHGEYLLWILGCGLLLWRRIPWDLAWISALCVVPLMLATWLFPHYAAPALASFWVLKFSLVARTETLLQSRAWYKPWMRHAASSVMVGIALLTIYSQHLDSQRPAHSRQTAEQQLLETPGLHLVFVKWSSSFDGHDEWVNNLADLQTAKIIWVRDLLGPSNLAVAARFPARRVWVAEPEKGPELRESSPSEP